MAELKRLKEIVDQAVSTNRNSNRIQLFLLDEILQGTNSRERQIAVSRVIKRLVDAGSIGAVSSHDLELATLPELHSICRTVHFCESFEQRDGKETMTFDYKMRTGVSPTTNALKLLELVGLGSFSDQNLKRPPQ
jgi:DNA mismatch repair ATPase MutS